MTNAANDNWPIALETNVNRQLGLLHPYIRNRAMDFERALMDYYARMQMKMELNIFETWRHPARQDYLFRQGYTKARAWQSAHQYGLAIDLAGKTKAGAWTWALNEADIRTAQSIAKRFDLVAPIAWDPTHFEWKLWKNYASLLTGGYPIEV